MTSTLTSLSLVYLELSHVTHTFSLVSSFLRNRLHLIGHPGGAPGDHPLSVSSIQLQIVEHVMLDCFFFSGASRPTGCQQRLGGHLLTQTRASKVTKISG